MAKKKPTLALGGEGIPTLEDLIALFRNLTGREPTPEDLEKTKATYARITAKMD